MQYEVIILELMTRIKKLEEEVEALKEAVERLGSQEVNDDTACETDEASEERRGQGPYKKMTDEMMMICYQCGKQLNEGANAAELANLIVGETGMNRNSAIMYIYAVSSLLSGTVFKRAISTKALKRYYDMISREYGSVGLKKALQATRLHIAYRKDCDLTSDALEELCDQYEQGLSQG